MNTPIEQKLEHALFALADEAYCDFLAPLIPNIPKETILGIRTPALRKFAKQFAKTEDVSAFLASLPHRYYEENNLHAFLLETLREMEEAERALEAFLPYVDNWATCDGLSMQILRKYPEKRMELAKRYIASPHTYTMRFGIGILMRFELDEAFTPEILSLAASASSEDYYVHMMQAWFFATALAKHYDETVAFLKRGTLSVWVHNKTIRKAIESHRITAEQKTYLRTLSRKA